jgi:hypothetical protein
VKKGLVLASASTLVLGLAIPVALAASSLTSPTVSEATGGTPTHIAQPSPASYGYRPLHPDQYAREKALANSQAFGGDAKANGHGKPGSGGGAPTVTTYPNVSPSFNANYQTGLTPPDTTGAIGNDRYIQAINTKYTIYSRTGSQINTGSLMSLTNITTLPNNGACFLPGSSPSHSDPQIMWDIATQRFYYTDVWYDGTFLSCAGLSIGFSKTATPASASDFCHYKVDFGPELPDYPKQGDSRDFLLYGYNKFGAAGSSYDGSEFMTFNKPAAGSTCPAASAFSLHFFGVGSLATPVPANLVDDSNGTGYVVTNPDLTTVSSTSVIRVYSVSWDGHTLDPSGHPNPSVSSAAVSGVASYSLPPNAPEKGSSALIDTMDGRFEAAVAAVDPTTGRGMAVWTAHAVKSGDGLRSEERWYEINPSGSLYDHGAAASSSLFVWNGAVSPDRNGSGTGSFGDGMAMSVSTSSSTTYPAIQFLWKKGGTQSSLQSLVQATGPNVDFSCSPCRWGDYSGAAPDPAASGTGNVWLTNQYNLGSSTNSGTDWRTWIFAVTPT